MPNTFKAIFITVMSVYRKIIEVLGSRDSLSVPSDHCPPDYPCGKRPPKVLFAAVSPSEKVMVLPISTPSL